MLRINIELHPYGNKDKAKILSSFDIANDGTGNDDFGNYIHRESENHPWKPSVRGWSRHRSAEELVYHVLKQKYDK